MLQIKKILFLFFLSTILFFSCQQKQNLVAQKGVLDLRNYDLVNEPIVPLSGEWLFFWKKFIQPDLFLNNNIDLLSSHSKDIAFMWNSKKGLTPTGYATYHLKVLLPQEIVGKTLAIKFRHILTSYRFYVNETLVMQSGIPAKNKADSVPLYGHFERSFLVTDTTLHLTAHVSNFFYSKAGLRSNSFVLSTSENIYQKKILALSYDFFLLGILSIMALYHLALFFQLKKNKSYLMFFLFLTFVAIRTMIRGEMILTTFFSSLNFQWQIRFEYFSFYFAILSFYQFLDFSFPDIFKRTITKIVYVIIFSFALVTLFTSTMFFTRLIVYFQIFSLGVSILILLGTLDAIRKKKSGGWITLIGSGILLFTLMNDILFHRNISSLPELTPYGIFSFVFAQALMLSLQFTRIFDQMEVLTQYLKKLEQATVRFVPQKLLEFLGRINTTDIRLGDNIQKNISVLFIDIRNFTTISENMTPENSFYFLNAYLKEVVPVVHEYHGIIEKYLGDGIIILFPSSPDHAVAAAINIQKQIRNFNEKNKNFPFVQAGIGIHYDNFLLGVVGEKQRYDVITISQSFITPMDVENLTKIVQTPIIVSEQLKNNLQKTYKMRELWNIEDFAYSVYEILDVYEEKIFNQRITTIDIFRQGIHGFKNGSYVDAKKNFTKILSIDPEDKVARHYLGKLN